MKTTSLSAVSALENIVFKQLLETFLQTQKLEPLLCIKDDLNSDLFLFHLNVNLLRMDLFFFAE